MNLASSFVNGFVNAAFGQDKLLTDDGNKWLYKNKDHGMILFILYLCVALLPDKQSPGAVPWRALYNSFLSVGPF